jgi:signal transduction histidine kinase
MIVASAPKSAQRDGVRALALYPWIILVLIVFTTALHYLTPQTRSLPVPANAILERHTVERFLFVLPVIVATYAFRWKGGLLTLVITVLIMLPRVFWVTPFPTNALIETLAAAATGGLAIWTIDAQARQRALCQKAASRLSALNAVSEEITSELELDKVLPKVLEIAEDLVGADAGGIALAGECGMRLHYPYLHNLPSELADVSIPVGQGLAGQVMATGRPAIVRNYQAFGNAIPAFVQAGLTSVVSIPIVRGERTFGALTLASIDEAKHFADTDVALLTGIGRQAGIAIENARLYQRMRFYARQIIRVQEEERKRIARELHDETIQMLIVISRRLELLPTPPESHPQSARQLLQSVQALLRDTQQGVRRFAQGLRPPTLDDLGLAAAIRGLANDLAESDGIEPEVSVLGQARRLAPEEELTLFRIAQEALNNVWRHSGASRVTIQLAFGPDCVRMTVSDNGCGFDAPHRTDDLVTIGKLGLIGMDERAQSLGGTLTIQSAPGQGTEIVVDIPVQSKTEQTGEGAATLAQ